MQNMHAKTQFRATISDKINNSRAHPSGVIQVKKNTHPIKMMLRSGRETSDGVGMCLEIG